MANEIAEQNSRLLNQEMKNGLIQQQEQRTKDLNNQ